MEFGVLGPLRVVVSDKVVDIPSARQRALLAALLLSANHAVSTDRLIDSIWGQHPAESAQNLVRTYIWRLRAALTEEGEPRLLTEPAGYLLRVKPGELDLAEFERLLGEGKSALARQDATRAAANLRTALDLWRGEPFVDVTLHDGNQASEIARLTEARIAGLEARIEADLSLGLHDEVIGELQQLEIQYPLRERFASQLMLACYRAGRRGDALATYRRLRARLVKDLGLDPSHELRDLHERILRSDTDPHRGHTARQTAQRVVPRQLPAVPAQFAGRTSELKRLTELSEHCVHSGGAVVISAIDGTAGIGKTTLAVYWAHQNQGRFPDGQLHVNLRGFARDSTPATAAEAVRGFLDALAVPADRIPNGLEAQISLYRSLLNGKRMLVLLDNARDTDQVRPLLPGSPTCLTVITSRNPLAGLIAAEAAHPLTLDLLTAAEAHELLTARLGPERTGAEPDATARLIERCARLPLALSIAAARATLNPSLPLADLVAELHDIRARLDALDIGDTTTDLRAVFTWSYQNLTAPAARLFRLLGLHAGPDISIPAAASLAAVPMNEAQQLVNELIQAHLLSVPTPGRYSFHDLLRAYAAEQADIRDGEAPRREAVHRTLDHYLHSAYGAARLLFPAREPITLAQPRPGTVPESLSDAQQALAWLKAEHHVLLTAVAQAAIHRFDIHAWQLPWSLGIFLDRQGHWRDFLVTQTTALAAAERLGDTAALMSSRLDLGRAYAKLGSYQEAQFHVRHALAVAEHESDEVGQARVHHILSWVLGKQGLTSEALGHAERSLSLYRAAEYRAGQATALNDIGWYNSVLGNHAQALAYCQQALDVCTELGNQAGLASAWDSLGYAHHQLGNDPNALTCYQHALDLYVKQGDLYHQANVLAHIGDTHHATGHAQLARDAWLQALSVLDDLQHPDADNIRTKLHAQTPPAHGYKAAESPTTSER